MEIYQSVTEIPLGYGGLPDFIKSSTVLTANDVATLASLKALPTEEAIGNYTKDYAARVGDLRSLSLYEIHQLAKELIKDGKTDEAMMVLMGFGP